MIVLFSSLSEPFWPYMALLSSSSECLFEILHPLSSFASSLPVLAFVNDTSQHVCTSQIK